MNNICQKLSQAYHILELWGLDDHTYTHASARSEDKESFYIYPFGLRFEEVTPDCFMQVNLNGDVLKGKEYSYNETGYNIHKAIYQNRPDIECIIHIHTPEIVAVSACKIGLMPISQWALHFYDGMSYHNYQSLALHSDQGESIAADLETSHFNILLHNHGSISCGRTIEEAMFYTYHLQKACETQCKALAMQQELIIPPEHMCKKAVEDLLSFEENLGERDWAAWLRYLNNQKARQMKPIAA